MPEILCGHSGCKNTSQDRFCEKHRDRHKPNKDLNIKDSRRSTTDNQSTYNKQRWKNLRDAKIIKDPYCEHCARYGIDTFATEVDHILEITDFPELAFEFSNLQSLCRSCHQAKTNKERAQRVKEMNTNALIKHIIKRANK